MFVLVQHPLSLKKTMTLYRISLYKTYMNKDIIETAKQDYDTIYFHKLK